MVRRQIIWTKTADVQFLDVLEYWVNRNKSNKFSIKLLNEVSKRTIQIAESPLIFKKADFPNTRVASLNNYSIFYKVEPDKLIITAFWDNRQNPKSLLEILKSK